MLNYVVEVCGNIEGKHCHDSVAMVSPITKISCPGQPEPIDFFSLLHLEPQSLPIYSPYQS